MVGFPRYIPINYIYIYIIYIYTYTLQRHGRPICDKALHVAMATAVVVASSFTSSSWDGKRDVPWLRSQEI